MCTLEFLAASLAPARQVPVALPTCNSQAYRCCQMFLGGEIPPAVSPFCDLQSSSDRLQALTSCSLLVDAAPCGCPPSALPRLLLHLQGHGARVEQWGRGPVAEQQRPNGHAGNGAPGVHVTPAPGPSSQEGPSQLCLTPPGHSLFLGNGGLLKKSVQAGAQNS